MRHKPQPIESIDIELSIIGPAGTTITFVRRNFRRDGPTWRIHKTKLTKISKASQQRLQRAIDARPMYIHVLALSDSMNISYTLTPKAYTSTRTCFYTFPKEPTP